jgi:hypothetical protein
MGDTPTHHPSDGSERYEIRINGHLGSRWAAWFDGMTLTSRSDGTTVIEGAVVDQAALHGLLRKLRDIGLPLISVMPTESDQSRSGATEPHERAPAPTAACSDSLT